LERRDVVWSSGADGRDVVDGEIFSKVCVSLHVPCKMTVELTFENFVCVCGTWLMERNARQHKKKCAHHKFDCGTSS